MRGQEIPANMNAYLWMKMQEVEKRKASRQKHLYYLTICGLVLATIPVMWLVGMR